MNDVRNKIKTQFKLLYRVFKAKDGYHMLIGIYLFTTLIQLK